MQVDEAQASTRWGADAISCASPITQRIGSVNIAELFSSSPQRVGTITLVNLSLFASCYYEDRVNFGVKVNFMIHLRLDCKVP